MRYRYLHYDVFTAERFGGNQLAVLPHASGLSSEQMQAITREFNFSESTFVLPRVREDTDVRMRIFTPGREMPMAGHPTVGSTFALCHEGVIPAGQRRWVFGLNIGPTPVDIEWEGTTASFVWMNQDMPRFGPQVGDASLAARSLGLDEEDLAKTGLPVEQVSCGVPFVFFPVATRRAVDNARPNLEAFASLCRGAGTDDHAMFVFSAERSGDRATVYSRMFAPGLGVFEDPATGAASGPLGCYLVHHGVVRPEDAGSIVSLQGVKMGRPSWIHIDVGIAGGTIDRVRVGGKAVLVAEGEMVV
ncbi:MAG: PhzF family phenazine biosynthesis protein [Vicinamibacterales bacterium]